MIKIGDTIIAPSIWDSHMKFIVVNTFGNSYYFTLATVLSGKPNTPKHRYNIGLNDAKIVDSLNRPFKKLDKMKLIKLVVKKNTMAKKELLIRNNCKKYGI